MFVFAEVPGLLEKRPSLVIGDTVLVSDPGVRISLPSSFCYRPGVTLFVSIMTGYYEKKELPLITIC
jgi:hypothetical protein